MSHKQVTILYVDNEIEFTNHFINLFNDHPSIKQILLADTAEKALYKIVSELPDIVFVDLGKQGIDLSELIIKNKFTCKIVIMSKDKNNALYAIQNNVYDFILKPVKHDIVIEFINQLLNDMEGGTKKIAKWLFKEEDSRIRLSSISDYIFVDPKEIVYCEADGAYTIIHFDNGSSELVNYYLGKVSEKLSSGRLFRISRFYLINLEKLYKVDKIESVCTLIAGKNNVTLSGTKKSLRKICNIEF